MSKKKDYSLFTSPKNLITFPLDIRRIQQSSISRNAAQCATCGTASPRRMRLQYA
jgi:hypothetical protein